MEIIDPIRYILNLYVYSRFVREMLLRWLSLCVRLIMFTLHHYDACYINDQENTFDSLKYLKMTLGQICFGWSNFILRHNKKKNQRYGNENNTSGLAQVICCLIIKWHRCFSKDICFDFFTMSIENNLALNDLQLHDQENTFDSSTQPTKQLSNPIPDKVMKKVQ